MNKLHEPEVVPAGFGKGWTVVRGGRDEHGPFQDSDILTCGENG